eukprot:6482834-Amphidinium_carterae.2
MEFQMFLSTKHSLFCEQQFGEGELLTRTRCDQQTVVLILHFPLESFCELSLCVGCLGFFLATQTSSQPMEVWSLLAFAQNGILSYD